MKTRLSPCKAFRALITKTELENHIFVHLTVMMLLIAGSLQVAAGQDLSLVGANDNAIDLVVPASGVVPLVFHYAGTDGPSYNIDLSAFLSEGDQTAAVIIRASGDTEPGTLLLNFPGNLHRAALQLHIRELIPGVKYIGTLTASSAKGLQSWTVTLHRPNPRAELITDLDRVELSLKVFSIGRFFSRLFGKSKDSTGFMLTLSEQSRDVPVEGITIRRADGSNVKTVIDLEKHLQFSLDGVAAPRLTSWPVKDSAQLLLRSIPPGQQRSLRVNVADLPRGEHNLLLELDAMNAKPGTAPKVELVVNVRHSIVWAVILLFLAILISFFITKGVINWRQRLNLQERTRALRREWLEELRVLAPVVWLRVTRKQAEMVLEKFSLLPAPGELAERLDKAARLLDLLRRYRDLQKQLRFRSFPYMLNWRMQEELDEIVNRIEPDLLDEANKASIAAEFDLFDIALGDPVSMYKPLVMQAKRKVMNMVFLDGIEEALDKVNVNEKDKKTLAGLMNKYIDSDSNVNPTLEDLILADGVCSSFRVLWRYKDDPPTLKKLFGLIVQDEGEKIPMDQVFQIADAFMWSRIQDAVAKNEACISPSKENPPATPVEALYPTRFEVILKNDIMNDSFVVKKRMTAYWTFTFTPTPRQDPWWRQKLNKKTPEAPKPHDWVIRTTGKNLVQFAPDAGKLETRVKLQHDNQETAPLQGEIIIQPSRTHIAQRLFAIEEVVLISVSVTIALASGLVLYYLPNPSFGSLQDYLALFTWGVGVEQGKNLVQTFQNLRIQSKATDTSV